MCVLPHVCVKRGGRESVSAGRNVLRLAALELTGPSVGEMLRFCNSPILGTLIWEAPLLSSPLPRCWEFGAENVPRQEALIFPPLPLSPASIAFKRDTVLLSLLVSLNQHPLGKQAARQAPPHGLQRILLYKVTATLLSPFSSSLPSLLLPSLC